MNMHRLIEQMGEDVRSMQTDVIVAITTTNGSRFMGTLDGVGEDFVSLLVNDHPYYIAIAHIVAIVES